ncbi:MAG: helix-turn-helix transcriptional regulator [Microbacterium sp.]|jgi:DNA-binding HxlR family transcriptional regulator|nr:helix-turn-helix transcriptional regulator [Microbacterium sp.]
MSQSIDYATLCSDPEQGRIIRDIMVRVGDKWSLLVVGALADGPVRFTALRDSIPGISQRMLTATLRGLARDGLVTRRSYGEVPPRVEYEHTAVGRTLIAPAAALAAWAIEHRESIAEARRVADMVEIAGR